MPPEPSDAATPPTDERSTAPAGDDQSLAEAAYAEFERLFVAHVGAFMLEAGRYVIDTFYGGEARFKGHAIPMKIACGC